MLVLAIGALAVILGACAGGGDSEPATAAPAPAAPAQPVAPAAAQPEPTAEAMMADEPKYGGVFNLAIRGNPKTIQLHRDGATPARQTIEPAFDTLLTFNAEGDYRDFFELEPSLAESWELENPQSYLFRLRKGVKFQDGSEFTAEDVVWSLEYLRNKENKFRRRSFIRDADTIEAVDKYTVRVTTKGPTPTFLHNLPNGNIPMASKNLATSGGDISAMTLGTGPFKLTSWDPKAGAEYVRNDDHWREGQPYLDGLKIFYNVDTATAIAAFTTKKNDVVKTRTQIEQKALRTANPGMREEAYPQNQSDHLRPRIDRPPFDDQRVRRAIHLIIDRQAMIDILTFGLGTINPHGVNGGRKGIAIPPDELLQLPGFRQPKDADLAEAKRLLAEAGYADFKLTISYNNTHTRHPAQATVVAAQLKEAGIGVSLKPLEEAVFRAAEKNGDFTLAFITVSYMPESNWSDWYASDGALNHDIRDPKLDALIDGQYSELDDAKRKGIFLDIQRYLMEKDYTIPLITAVGFVNYQPWVHGWGDNRAGRPRNLSWWKTWVDAAQIPSR
jgi:peptide/nickel transport system substrate-binding protein